MSPSVHRHKFVVIQTSTLGFVCNGYAFECSAVDGTDDVQLRSFPMEGCGHVQQVMFCLCKIERHHLVLELITDNSNSESACQATEDEKYGCLTTQSPLLGGLQLFPISFEKGARCQLGKGAGASPNMPK